MKLSQIIIKEDNEPDYTGIDDNIRERLSSYKSHEQQWALTELRKGENIESIIDGLEYYREKIKDNRFQQILKPITNPANPKSLTQITLQQVKTGQQQYDAKYGGMSKREAKKILKKSYAKKLIDEPDLKLIKIERTDDTDGAAKTLTQYAMNTKWCVTDLKMAEYYLKKGPIYYIECEKIIEKSPIIDGMRKNLTGHKYLCHPASEQLRDVVDDPCLIDVELYNKLVKYIDNIGMFLIDLRVQEHINALKHNPDLNLIYRNAIIKNPYLAYHYALYIIKGRWPEAEEYMMKDPVWASRYADDPIKGRWPEAEPTIMKHPNSAYWYAKLVIKDRWPEAEQYIMKDPYSACEYARNVIKGRWPEAERCIAERPFSAYEYAKDIIKGRWPGAEPYIMKDSESAYKYAKDVIKDRWPRAERFIIKSSDPYWASVYAIDIIKGRWPEAEPYIMKDPEAALRYAKDIINGRWPEAEPYIKNKQSLNPQDKWLIFLYAKDIIKGRWLEAEPYLGWVWPKYKEHFGIKDEE